MMIDLRNKDLDIDKFFNELAYFESLNINDNIFYQNNNKTNIKE